MKVSTKFYGLTFGALALVMLASCSNDINAPMPGASELNAVVAPARHSDVVAWSGNHSLGNTLGGAKRLGTRSLEPGQAPAYILTGSEEYNAVKNWFTYQDKKRYNPAYTPGTDVPNGEFLTIDEAFDGWTDYWVQCAVAEIVVGSGTGDEIKNIGVWSEKTDPTAFASGDDFFNSPNRVSLTDKRGEVIYMYTRKEVHDHPIADFSYGWWKVDGKMTCVFGLTPDEQRSGEYAASRPAYRIARIDGYDGVYVAFYTQKIDYENPSETNYGDDEWDVIIKLTRIETDTPSDEQVEHGSEVEVNLSINDKHTDPNGANYDEEDLVSKLSIHVKYPGDVRIVIPVEPQYYCAMDDLYILNDHKNYVYGGIEDRTITYNIGGHVVTLNVEFNERGLCVTTQGITEEVIEYCRTNYGDGLNFEIYSYFCKNVEKDGVWVRDDNLDIATLQSMFDKATIEFLGSKESPSARPDYYINAFGYEYENGKNAERQKANDCDVRIVDGQKASYKYIGAPTYHLNGTPYNYIYVKNGVTPDVDHGGK